MKQLIVIAVLCCLYISVVSQQSPEPPPGLMAGQPLKKFQSAEPGLLFYLSGKSNSTADFAAGGQTLPNFFRDVKTIPEGKFGAAFEAADNQLMSYWAPGNIYAQRGTLSFFWRSRYPLGPSPFPVFRVAFADHSSWDMVWLRIDYNGSGFDAFVTDIGLSRTRVSHFMDVLPKPDQWIHLALSWDETEGIKFYVDGKLVAKKLTSENIFDTGLDQFGPHSRIISPYQVQSEYSFVRGGDLDELRIYDRMLSDENISQLNRGVVPKSVPLLKRSLADQRWRDEWWKRNGWNLPNQPPPLLPSKDVTVRKVEIHEATDIKRWNWKGNDGIRETTWPGVYNMSRLTGRYDYFVLPDWDTYSHSGQTVKFQLPEEPWNQVEIWGKAWGQLTYEKAHAYDNTFAVRTQNQIKSYHTTPTANQGGSIRFDNALIEEPIGELGVYYVHDGKAPQASGSESFMLDTDPEVLSKDIFHDAAAFIDGRYPADEQEKMVGVTSLVSHARKVNSGALPFINILIPYSPHPDEGLDGIEIELPALGVRPTHQGLFPMNIRVKDPLWQMRDLADFSFSVRPNEAHTIWIDTRDRILPEGRVLYFTIAGAGADLTSAQLRGARVRLLYKSKEAARPEFELDRITQVRDLYGFTVEERPVSSRLNLYNRFAADNGDLLKVNPNNFLAKAYKYSLTGNPADRPDYTIPKAPSGVPEWAFLQTEYLRKLATIINYYIDKRQIGNGEFGGGLSDDDDFANLFVGTSFMGIEPEKTLKSLRLLMSGFYDNERDAYDANLKQRSLPLFTNGIATINTDLLHAYEEGIESVGQLLVLDYGNPLHFNHGMEIAKKVMDDVTGINSAGHRHFRSRFYGGTAMAKEDPWQWSGGYSYNMLHTAYFIARYNGNPAIKKFLVEMADGLLAHTDKGKVYPEIHFSDDKARPTGAVQGALQCFQAAYDLTGDEKYLKPLPAKSPENRSFNKDSLASRYAARIRDLGVREYINTEGTVWIDRIVAPDMDIQSDRLGGVALWRISNIYQQNYLSWKINNPGTYESLGIFVTSASPAKISLLVYNMDAQTINADMSVWNISRGRWRIVQGVDTNDDQRIDQAASERIVDLNKGDSLKVAFPPGKTSLINLELINASAATNSQLADLALGEKDLKIDGKEVSVRVYNLGSVDAPPSEIVLLDQHGVRIASATVPAIKAPLDLNTEWVEVRLSIPATTNLSGGRIQIDPDKKIAQITRLNDSINW